MRDSCLNLLSVLIREGYNLAFIYNTSVAGAEPGQCEQGVRCLAASLGATLARGWDNTLRGEMPLFKKVVNSNRASNEGSRRFHKRGDGPSRARDCEIFANLRLKLYYC